MIFPILALFSPLIFFWLIIHHVLLFPAIPAVGTKLAAVDSDGFDHIIKTVEPQGSKVQLYADPLYHLLILWRVRIGICT